MMGSSFKSPYALRSILGPYENATEKYFTLKNFFQPAEPQYPQLFQGAKLEY
jgi:hypothetical protein